VDECKPLLGGLAGDHATPLTDAWVFDPAAKQWAVAAGA